MSAADWPLTTQTKVKVQRTPSPPPTLTSPPRAGARGGVGPDPVGRRNPQEAGASPASRLPSNVLTSPAVVTGTGRALPGRPGLPPVSSTWGLCPARRQSPEDGESSPPAHPPAHLPGSLRSAWAVEVVPTLWTLLLTPLRRQDRDTESGQMSQALSQARGSLLRRPGEATPVSAAVGPAHGCSLGAGTGADPLGWLWATGPRVLRSVD